VPTKVARLSNCQTNKAMSPGVFWEAGRLPVTQEAADLSPRRPRLSFSEGCKESANEKTATQE